METFYSNYFESWAEPVAWAALGSLALLFLFLWLAESKKRISQRNNTPIDVLESRLARGEIDEERFEKIKSHIRLQKAR